MQPEVLVQLIGSGNTATVEEEWMRLVDDAGTSPARFLEYQVVLAELCRMRRREMAEELTWAAIETLSSGHSAAEALSVAGPFLLTLGESAEIRAQTVALYRTAYSDQDGLDALLTEAGLEGSRPVRRALRTLEVCLGIDEGSFLASRDEEGAARVSRIDRESWVFSITTELGEEELGAVHLADRYEPAAESDFRVIRHFALEKLAKRLQKDPVSVVLDICKWRGPHIDSDTLESLLVPRHLDAGAWKKWWTRTRTALKKCPLIRIEGRSPYTISYSETPAALEDSFQREFDKARDPLSQLAIVEKYLRECKMCTQAPAKDMLRRWYESFSSRAPDSSTPGLLWVIARRVGEAAGLDGAADVTVEALKNSSDVSAVFKPMESEMLLDLACRSLVEGRPDDWQEQLLGLLPMFPLSICDRTADRLVQAGKGRADFEPAITRIMADPIPHFEALLWLWDGPSKPDSITDLAAITILTRILRALEECRRSEQVSKETDKRITSRAKSVLSARKYERYHECLQSLEPGMAGALRTQINRVDYLGRVVREDMLKHLGHYFPTIDKRQEVPPWAREDVLYVTKAGLLRKQKEIEHHVNVKMKENSRAIGEAAARGDLSENSEYKFALEERDLLRARLGQMNDEVAKAQVLDPADVPEDQVGIGTKAVFRRVTDGQDYEMTFLGPWEADGQKGLFNYLAPVPQKIMGKRIGSTVQLDHGDTSGEYELVAVENVLAED